MKNNNFSEEYEKHEELLEAFKSAKRVGSKEEIEALNDEIASLRRSIEAKGDDYARTYIDYRHARANKNEYIDLQDSIQNEEVPALIERLRSFGIDHFTFSSRWSSAVETAWLFTENGCTLEGMVQIHRADGVETIPAYFFSIR